MTLSAEGYDADMPGRRFDAVLVDIDHSPRNLLHPRHAALYQPAGLARLAEHLRPGGVFALWSNDPPDDAFNAALAGVFARSAAHVVTFDNAQGDHDASQHRLCRGHGRLPNPWAMSRRRLMILRRLARDVDGGNLPLRNGHAMLTANK